MKGKYENGYLPKIEFWKGKLELAISSNNVGGIKTASEKIAYFATRQAEVYGNTTIAGVDFSESLNLLNSLSIR